MNAFTNADTHEECPLDCTKLRLIPRTARGDQFSHEVRLATMFNEEAFSDMTLRTRDGEIKAHKVVMCSASEVLSRALTGRFKEAQESYYNMSEESYEVVSRFVQFCYLLRYDTVGPTTTKHFADRQLKDETGVISSLEAGKGRIMIIRWPKRRLDHFSSGAFFQGGQLQAAHEDSLPSAEKLAHELNGRRFCLDIAMWRLADMYHVQPLKSHAFEQLRQRLYVYLSGNGTPAPFLYAIAPIYACTGNGDLVLRPLILRVLEACKAEILHDPLLSSRLSQIAADVDEFSQDHGRIFHAPIPSIWDGMPIPPMPQI